jgi:uncharacterized GH25 family protein
MKTLAVALTMSATLASGTALAHEFWLAPSTYAGTPRRVVEIGALAGTGFRGERLPWSPPHCVRLVARAANMLDLARAASIGDATWARFAPADDGGTMLAFESKFTPTELPAAQFDAYLKDEGLTGPLDARRRSPAGMPGRERYRRCAKAWLSGRDPARAIRPVGLPLEIVPQVPPGTDAQLPLRILWGGRPLAGALVKAWRAPLGDGGNPADGATRDPVGLAWQGRSDSRGQLIVPVAAPGEWIVSVVHMVPCRETSEADWESTWASLTFEGGSRARRTQ